MKNKHLRQLDLMAGSIWLGLMMALIWGSAINLLIGIYEYPRDMIMDNLIISVVFLAWFLVGAHKGLLLLAWQKKEIFSPDIRPAFKILLLMPFFTVIPFKNKWYRLPE